MTVLTLDSPAQWADAVAALAALPPLPARTVLVPAERHAHALRRTLALSGRGAALAGTRFVTPLAAAEEVLRAAGVSFAAGEERLRPSRLGALFAGELPLTHFPAALLRTAPGWEDAFARTIATLEGAGLSPRELPGDGPLRDVALVWSRLAEAGGASWSAARILREAADLLERSPRAWPFPGPVLAAVTGHETAAQARFIRALPERALAVWRRQPAGARDRERLARSYGPAAAAALDAPPVGTACAAAAPGAGAGTAPPAVRGADAASGRPRELDLLRSGLFAPPGAARVRGAGPDGSVALEEHAGVEAELEAAAAWVAREVLERGRALEDVAVLVPAQDPLALLVAERLARLPFGERGLPVHVAGGVPAVSTAAGARLLAALRALDAHLAAGALAELLPALRLTPGEEREPAHLTRGDATELAWALGTTGGSPARPEGALEWAERARSRRADLEAALARPMNLDGGDVRGRWRLHRTLRHLERVLPALDGLVAVARAVVGGEPLAALWRVLGPFLAETVLAPGEGPPLAGRLDEVVRPACAGALGGALRGRDALAHVARELRALRVPRGRYGEPAVYVGTLAGAAGLPFAAVRVIGLCEGAVPSAPREDPLLPEAARERLERAAPERVVPGPADRAAAERQALHAAVQGAAAEVVLSVPRVDLARTEREPAALFVDAAAALGRPDAVTGAPAASVPDAGALRRDAFLPAHAEAAAFRRRRPVAPAAWLDRVARDERALPAAWRTPGAGALAPERLAPRAAAPPGPADGVLGADGPFPPLPGLDPEEPISASALQVLLACPRRFLMERVLGWDEPAGAPTLTELDPLAFGTLVHRVHEELYRAHGAEIDERRRTLEAWLEVASAAADSAFDAFLREHPLPGAEVRKRERERVRDAIRAFVEYDWKSAPARRFGGVEIGFGYDQPVALEVGGAPVYVGGFIDRLDVEGAALVRDLKTGRPHPRVGDEAAPTPELDVQLGLYVLALKKGLSRAWNLPWGTSAAYVYVGRGDPVERAFRGNDALRLLQLAPEWLATGVALLRERAFLSTPHADDCIYCPFKPVCGAEAPRRAAACLAGLDDDAGALGRFRALKAGDDEEERP